MFEFVQDLSITLFRRYETIEKNIESESPSFYDSTLSFLEETARTISEKENLEVDYSLSFIKFIYQDAFKNFILGKCKLDKMTFNNVHEISTIINEHKHSKQRTLKIDEIVSFMEITFEFVSSYHKYLYNEKKLEFNKNYYYNIYGKTQKEVDNLFDERDRLEKSLKIEHAQNKLVEKDYKAIRNLTQKNEIKQKDLEKQKELLLNEVNQLKDIKLTTMEEKVASIVDILDRQTKLLEAMNEKIDRSNKLSGRQTKILSNL